MMIKSIVLLHQISVALAIKTNEVQQAAPSEDDFLVACAQGDLDTAQRYLECGGDIHARSRIDDSGITGVVLASAQARDHMVDFLLTHKANILDKTEFDTSMLTALLSCGPDDRTGTTDVGILPTMSVLLKHKIPIDFPDVFRAVRTRKPRAVSLLVQHKADPNQYCQWNNGQLRIAGPPLASAIIGAQRCDLNVVNMLLRAGVYVQSVRPISLHQNPDAPQHPMLSNGPLVFRGAVQLANWWCRQSFASSDHSARNQIYAHLTAAEDLLIQSAADARLQNQPDQQNHFRARLDIAPLPSCFARDINGNNPLMLTVQAYNVANAKSILMKIAPSLLPLLRAFHVSNLFNHLQLPNEIKERIVGIWLNKICGACSDDSFRVRDMFRACNAAGQNVYAMLRRMAAMQQHADLQIEVAGDMIAFSNTFVMRIILTKFGGARSK